AKEQEHPVIWAGDAKLLFLRIELCGNSGFAKMDRHGEAPEGRVPKRWRRAVAMSGRIASVDAEMSPQGCRSVRALPLLMSKGSELCPWVTTHPPGIRRKPLVARHHISTATPFLVLPDTRLRL